ncbi:hypothetical protein D3P07_17640 [Paenibacillus sp. 1011MAR3C5]|uniref:hypothetical protein n=1 Tax=Paenibacillus sp. 1011MAR3C5 TaxID=1675787 RepID=UPI000E6CA9E2|nr:hypothetical protein [Paenibacillus sp. 1011MAR3C5]RJE86997.1 hypothetical protein D3P07_17640 [Paenibacillus sp. 1011MAR3C5]
MQTVGIWALSGPIFLIIMTAIFFFLLFIVIRSAINQSDLRKGMEQELKQIKHDLHHITELLEKREKNSGA